MLREGDELQARMDAEANATAHGLVQGYIGADHKVLIMQSFNSALVQALKASRKRVKRIG